MNVTAIEWLHLVEQPSHETGQHGRAHRADRDPGTGQRSRLPEHHPQHVVGASAQRHPDPDLLRALGDAVGDQPVNPHRREEKSGPREHGQQHHRQAALGEGVGEHLLQRLDSCDRQVGVLFAHDRHD